MLKKAISIVLVFCMAFTIAGSSFAGQKEITSDLQIKLIERKKDNSSETLKYLINNKEVTFKVNNPENNKQILVMNEGMGEKKFVKNLNTGVISSDGVKYAKIEVSNDTLSKEINNISLFKPTTRGSWSEQPFYGSWQDYTANKYVKTGSIKWYEGINFASQGVILSVILLALNVGTAASIAIAFVITVVMNDRPDYTYFKTTRFRHNAVPGCYEYNSYYYYNKERTNKYTNDVDTVYSMTW